jgi:hypothetical protein
LHLLGLQRDLSGRCAKNGHVCVSVGDLVT